MGPAKINQYPEWPSPRRLREFAANNLAQLNGAPLGYSIASEAIRTVVGTKSSDQHAAYCTSLREPLAMIRDTYRSSTNQDLPVAITYSGQVALAYCAAYLNPYVDVARRSIMRALDPSGIGNSLNIGIIGPGPCPEVVALLHLLSTLETPPPKVKLRLFDAHHSAWRPVRKAVIQSAMRYFPSIAVTSVEARVNLGADSHYRAPSESIPFDLVIGQNFLNEGVSDSLHLLGNLGSIFERVKPGGSMMIADHRNESARRGLFRIRHWNPAGSTTTSWSDTEIKSCPPAWGVTPELRGLFETHPHISPRLNTRFAAVRITKRVS